MQATNEELRAATEELETQRSDLVASNQRAFMIGAELRQRVTQLARRDDDMRNLIDATAIATVFVDRQLCVMSYTPPFAELFGIVPSDVGRPLADVAHRLSYSELAADLAAVLADLCPLERGLSGDGGREFVARLRPYRTTDEQIAGVVLTVLDVTSRVSAQAAERTQRRLEQRVEERTAELEAVNDALRTEVTMHEQAELARQELQRRLVNAHEEERRRISRELHDEAGQQITAFMLSLKSLESDLSPGPATIKLRELRDAAEHLGHDIHELASQLRPITLDLGLLKALGGYLDAWGERSGIRVDFASAWFDDPRLPDAIEATLFRIVQEALNNVFKHASASTVSVNLERRRERVIVVVEDDGAGFDAESLAAGDRAHIGIAGMRERAANVGGVLTMESRPGSGTTVRAQLPSPASERSVGSVTY